MILYVNFSLHSYTKNVLPTVLRAIFVAFWRWRHLRKSVILSHEPQGRCRSAKCEESPFSKSFGLGASTENKPPCGGRGTACGGRSGESSFNEAARYSNPWLHAALPQSLRASYLSEVALSTVKAPKPKLSDNGDSSHLAERHRYSGSRLRMTPTPNEKKEDFRQRENQLK